MASNNAEAGDVTTAASQPAAGSKPVVCFLGPTTSYTHQATLSAFPTDKFELMPVVTIKDIFETTQSGRAAYGVVPFENSTNGSVVSTLDCFADRAGAHPDLAVCAEIYLGVHHCLVGRRRRGRRVRAPRPSPPPPPPPPSSAGIVGGGGREEEEEEEEEEEVKEEDQDQDLDLDLSQIRRIYSHPQAFGQCARFLAARLRGAETVDVSSTSRAAEMVRDESSSSTSSTSSSIFEAAAISSAAAAEMLGLDVLARNIEDRPDNTTRFFVLRKGAAAAAAAAAGGDGAEGDDIESLLYPRRRLRLGDSSSGGGGGDGSSQKVVPSSSASSEETGAATPTPPPPPPPPKAAAAAAAATKSLVSFTVPHRSPGALADVLDCFRRSGLNLTSIDSRPSLLAPFQYVFFAEFEGHRLRDPGGRVRDALAGVAAAARAWRWLGSWENMLAAAEAADC